ncbi:MAG: phosphoglycerate kinase [Desulfofustis sp.]|jgi:phosphoglycerate kinase|nr:phosphoglycerate kinase [Desulfofustis sp.]
MKSIRDLDLENRRVLVRVDFNVPMDESGAITDDIRIREALPTLEYVRQQRGRLIICSHRGRPKGQRAMEFSLRPVAAHLETLLGCRVTMADDCIGADVEQLAQQLGPGDVMMLENLRFYQQETDNDPGFSERLARLADVYVNDAFAVSHRAHASVAGVADRVSVKGAGFLLQKEMDYFHQAMDDPVRPLAAIVGGAKVSSKLGALENMLSRVDKMLIGGAMANTFLKCRGVDVGGSLVEDELLDTARDFIAKADKQGVALYFPVDFVAAEAFAADAAVKNVTYREIPKGWLALDIGPATVTYFQEALADVKTIVWNGPMGAFEIDAFARGTMALCHAVAASHALSITGGGDSNAAVKKAGVSDQISYMSTGGGAFLQLMEGKPLPGVEALK